jgi:hypothetical protein
MPNVDSNGNAPAMAVTDDAAATPTQLRVDPVTGYVICVAASGTVGGVAPTRITEDANGYQTGTAVTDDANEATRPLAVTDEGYLLISE